MNSAFGEDLSGYCKKNIKGIYGKKKKNNICGCVEENLRRQLTADERVWLVQASGNKPKEASVEMTESSQKRIKSVEFQVFKNCSMNYKWKVNADDIGVPDDITTP